MVNNQNEFNEKFSNKKVKQIESLHNRSFQGELIIEDYSELKILNLREVTNIDKIILKNLPKNLLDSLEFIKDLENLEELEVDESNENTNTLELLRKIKVLEKEKEFSNIKYDELKKFLKKILISLSQGAKHELAVELNKKINRKTSLSAPGMTKELMLNIEKIVKKQKAKELERKLNEEKEREFELKEDQSINTYQIQYNVQYQQLETETEKQITASLTDKEVTLEEQKVINKTILFLGTKELFINYRQATINNLIECYNRLEKRLGSKLNKFTNAVSMTNIAGKLASIIPGGGVVEVPIGLLGDTINLTGTIIQGKDLEKFTKQFQEILVSDKKNLSLFDDLKKTEQSPFSDENDVLSQSVSGT
ncbi:15281_t:CDS:2 [Funneliformis geosporum]|uniref:15281_t:CDS:1 n=1 Tax=Funneliformis geosporum TaxID=1117311 RepID=A0A9W4SBY0_9GLOM|nr:15281_t:CDS:2 [Funneliformis geosporum]